jgi:serine/threonine protein kinase
MMARLTKPDATFRDVLVDGTAGYVAPESFRKFEYSAKSDIFQAGVCLYSMLSGLAPFDPNIPNEVLTKPYRPTIGPAWDNISNSAKDLISNILNPNPTHRFDATQILTHTWLNGEANEIILTADYFERIKSLALKNKLRKFFTEINIEEINKTRKASLAEVLPFLDPIKLKKKKQIEKEKEEKKKKGKGKGKEGYDDLSVSRHGVMVARKGDELSMSTHGGGKTFDVVMDPEFFTKLRLLKNELVHYISPYKSTDNMSPTSGGSVDPTRVMSGMSTASNGSGTSGRSLILSEGDHNIQTDEIPFDTYVALMDDFDLPQLATRDVFDIFDYNEAGMRASPHFAPPNFTLSGVIDIKEFLVTMLAFHDDTAAKEQGVVSKMSIPFSTLTTDR